jgi:hypothetical protein
MCVCVCVCVCVCLLVAVPSWLSTLVTSSSRGTGSLIVPILAPLGHINFNPSLYHRTHTSEPDAPLTSRSPSAAKSPTASAALFTGRGAPPLGLLLRFGSIVHRLAALLRAFVVVGLQSTTGGTAAAFALPANLPASMVAMLSGGHGAGGPSTAAWKSNPIVARAVRGLLPWLVYLPRLSIQPPSDVSDSGALMHQAIQTHMPVLPVMGPALPDLVPTLLLLFDDSDPTCKAMALRAFWLVLQVTSPAELQWFATLLLQALQRTLYIRDPIVLEPLLACLLHLTFTVCAAHTPLLVSLQTLAPAAPSASPVRVSPSSASSASSPYLRASATAASITSASDSVDGNGNSGDFGSEASFVTIFAAVLKEFEYLCLVVSSDTLQAIILLGHAVCTFVDGLGITVARFLPTLLQCVAGLLATEERNDEAACMSLVTAILSALAHWVPTRLHSHILTVLHTLALAAARLYYQRRCVPASEHTRIDVQMGQLLGCCDIVLSTLPKNAEYAVFTELKEIVAEMLTTPDPETVDFFQHCHKLLQQ